MGRECAGPIAGAANLEFAQCEERCSDATTTMSPSPTTATALSQTSTRAPNCGSHTQCLSCQINDCKWCIGKENDNAADGQCRNDCSDVIDLISVQMCPMAIDLSLSIFTSTSDFTQVETMATETLTFKTPSTMIMETMTMMVAPANETSTSSGLIIGLVVAFAALCAVVAFFYLRRRRQSTKKDAAGNLSDVEMHDKRFEEYARPPQSELEYSQVPIDKFRSEAHYEDLSAVIAGNDQNQNQDRAKEQEEKAIKRDDAQNDKVPNE